MYTKVYTKNNRVAYSPKSGPDYRGNVIIVEKQTYYVILWH